MRLQKKETLPMAETRLVGILNLTPDSFSDGGKFSDKDAALDAISRMIAAGAHVIDIGAESTRPGAPPVSPQEEWRRLEPVLQSLASVKQPNISFSLDTRHAENAAKALEIGIDWINDVTGFISPAMINAVKASSCTLVMMHSLGIPANRSITLPQSANVTETLITWAKERIALLEQQGILRNRIVFDPGIGFGKTPQQSFALIRDIKKFMTLGVRVMVGHSRKSFLASLGDRDDATLAASFYLAEQGVDYLRVHDVPRHTQMLNVWSAIAYDDRQSQHRRTA
jgi:dihydropteroate synthase